VLLALIIGGGVFLLLTNKITPPTQGFLVAAHALPAGTVIQAGDVMAKQVDPGAVPAGAIAESDQASAMGRLVTESFEPGDYITTAHLANAPGRLASGLAPEMRLVTISLKNAQVVDGQQPGDRVDLLYLGGNASGGDVLILGLAIRTFAADGSIIAEVPLNLAIYLAQLQQTQLVLFSAPDGESFPTISEGNVCEIVLTPAGQVMQPPLPTGYIPCPAIYGGGGAPPANS
jgi:hypothetical protein